MTTVMTSDDSGRVIELMHAEHLAVSVAHFRGDNQFVTDYLDMQPNKRTGEARLQMTHMKNLYDRMTDAGGVWCALRTEQADVAELAGFQRIVWTKLEAREKGAQ